VNYLEFDNTPVLESIESSRCGEHRLAAVYSQTHRVHHEGHMGGA
jgi:hypothetical protein